ncbi:hypothetical protein VKT23_010239 [Stygiomarasmius scandens]|uniref:Uncharacterized protein n=1 Tax=Marasmiellus scandens TaxID=2682957 RepID=A0ABR1JDE2_9AGAR
MTLQVPLILVATAFSFFYVEDKAEGKMLLYPLKDVDFLGSLLFSATLVPLLVAGASIAHVFQHPTTASVALITVGICISIISGIRFFQVEMKAQNPIIPLNLMRNRTVIALCAMNFCGAMGYQSALYLLPIILISVQNQSVPSAGMHLVPVTVVAALGSLIVGAYISKSQKYLLFLLLGGGLLVLGPMLLTYDSISDLNAGAFIAELVGFFAVAMGSQITNALTLVAIMVQQDSTQLATCTGLLSRGTVSSTSEVLDERHHVGTLDNGSNDRIWIFG